MAGVKGRTGRRPAIEDMSLLTMTTSWLIANWYSFTDEQKMKVALIIAPKGISDKHEFNGTLDIGTILNRMANAQPSLQ